MIEQYYLICDLNLFCKHYIVCYTWMQKSPIKWVPSFCGGPGSRAPLNPALVKTIGNHNTI